MLFLTTAWEPADVKHEICVFRHIYLCIDDAHLFVLPFPHPPPCVCRCLGCNRKSSNRAEPGVWGQLKDSELSNNHSVPPLQGFLWVKDFAKLPIHWEVHMAPVVKHPAAKTGDAGLIPESGRSPGEGNGNPLQYSCLGNPMDRGAWWAIVHGVTKSWTQLSNWACMLCSLSRLISLW